MNDIENLIRNALPLSGLAAWGIRQPEGAFVGECLADWLWPDQIEQLTRKVATACAALPAHRLPTGNTCWVYERVRLYASLRADQACLVFVVENRAGGSLTKIQDLLQAFTNPTDS